RKKFAFKKVGHAGTLDPMATGLLVVLIGKATKKSKNFTDDDKTYKATLVLGITTDTGDADGKILKEVLRDIDPGKISGVLQQFKGEIEQIPPMFSAKKHKGKKLYEYARRGIEIKREPRKVIIKKLEVLDMKNSELSLEVCCSKGTYIRQLAIDIGVSLGSGAHISQLRRIKSGNFCVEESIKFDELNKATIESIHENFIQC
ncbi:MAG: tRNA pseudouridine(55) synthase TruB, partial [Candidatus Omnitrophica bacterium]|nr:tRNA pseudouridine(55) synthase TruB [Candidatus Omnitrophota bacterium]